MLPRGLIEAWALNEIRVGALINQSAILKHQDEIGMVQSRNAIGYQQGRWPFSMLPRIGALF